LRVSSSVSVIPRFQVPKMSGYPNLNSRTENFSVIAEKPCVATLTERLEKKHTLCLVFY